MQPYVALGLGLRQTGHAVRLATHDEFREIVVARGLEFARIHGSPRALLASEAGRAFFKSGRNPLAFVRSAARLIEPIAAQLQTDVWSACQDADAVGLAGWGNFPALLSNVPAYHFAMKHGLPCFGASLQPTTRTRTAPWWSLTGLPDLGGTVNWLTHLAAEQIAWQPVRRVVSAWLVAALGRTPAPFWGPWGEPRWREMQILYGYSPLVGPCPRDWPPWVHVTGYWFLDRPGDWQPPGALVDFFGAGPPPVCVGFGSLTYHRPEELTGLVLAALRRARRRGVLLTGWGGLRQFEAGEDVFVADAIPHDWLFPRVAAVVHHGGAGTTAAALRAGVPSVVCPFFGDQPFWADRVCRLGVSPPPIPERRLAVERLAGAISLATTDPLVQQRAATLGQSIRAENGVARAVETLQRYL